MQSGLDSSFFSVIVRLSEDVEGFSMTLKKSGAALVPAPVLFFGPLLATGRDGVVSLQVLSTTACHLNAGHGALVRQEHPFWIWNACRKNFHLKLR